MDSLFEFLEKSVNANYFTGFGLAATRIIGFPNNNNIFSASKEKIYYRNQECLCWFQVRLFGRNCELFQNDF